MIKVKPASEPAAFDDAVRKKGKRAMQELVGDPAAPERAGRPRKVIASSIAGIPGYKLPTYWQGDCLSWLWDGYGGVCAYLGMKINKATGACTVDHFKPKSKYPQEAYEWTNYRLANRHVNNAKGDHEDVLDPFTTEDGWFVLNIGTFEVEPAPHLPPERHADVKQTVARLRLNDRIYRDYRRELHDGVLGLLASADGSKKAALPRSHIEEEGPFIAKEMVRQKFLSPIESAAQAAPLNAVVSDGRAVLSTGDESCP